MTYIMELSEEQAEIIKISLEEYFRLRMNQVMDFANDLAFEGFNYKNHTSEEFDNRIECRDEMERELNILLRRFHPLSGRGGYRPQTMEMLRAQDVWQVLRQRLYLDRDGDPDGWSVDARDPMSMTGEKLPSIKKR